MTTSSSYHIDDFQRAPTGKEYTSIDRAESSQTHLEQNDGLKLQLKDRKFAHQYASVYYMRLEMLRANITKAAQDAWNGMKINDITARQCKKVLDVRQGRLVWLVGTVYKEMKYKPNILQEVTAKVYGPKADPPKQYFGDENDTVLLEDESGRLELCGERVASELLVTGSVIAVLGTEDSEGSFQVVDIKLPGYAPQPTRQPSIKDHRRLVALVSGLNVGSVDEDPIRLELLQEFLLGELGGEEDNELARSISTVVMVGNSIAEQVPEIKAGKSKYARDNMKYNGEPLGRLDRMISELCTSVKVAIMPGECDPTTHTMPQQPLHKGLFADSREFIETGQFQPTTNPYTFDIDNVHLLGCSGQTIDDICKYADFGDRLELMDYTLKWQHVAPTCPDTLWSYPFAQDDPFVVRTTPHVYVVGNQQKFDTRMVGDAETQIRLVTLPEFSKTGQLALLDLDSLEVKLMQIS